jgi:hypothetical protein
VRVRVAACGCVWLRVAACGCVWLRVAACGCAARPIVKTREPAHAPTAAAVRAACGRACALRVAVRLRLESTFYAVAAADLQRVAHGR